MEFVEGGQVNDRDYMERNKIDVNQVSGGLRAAVQRDHGLARDAWQGLHVQVETGV
jgi:hypothetical protein